MNLRFDAFTRYRVEESENGHTTKLKFEIPHHAMLTNLSEDELEGIKYQCNRLLNNPREEKTIYLSNIIKIEEVTK